MGKKMTVILEALMLLFFMGGGEAVEIYKDPSQLIHRRIKDLMGKMSLAEKIGQMTQLDRTAATPEIMKEFSIGSLLSGGGSVPRLQASPQEWIEMVNGFQNGSLSSRLGIPMIYGIDAVHGHNNVYKATIFPHNVGLGATRDPKLVERIGAATALEVRATGINYAFAPCIAGFVISDWQGIDRITSPPHANYTYSVHAGIHAGIDMIMVPFNHTEFIDTLTKLVESKVIPMRRINDAVHRILRVKFLMGLFENPLADNTFVDHLGNQAHRDLAREAVRKSMVLLKNGETADPPLLPLPKKAGRILVAGTHADNLGYQCGGWTITWQGLAGNNLTQGTTILSAISSAVDPSTDLVYKENPDLEFVKTGNFSFAVVVVGEHPYAETDGDNSNLTIPEPGPATITNVCGGVKCVVVVVSGRPLLIQPYLRSIHALVAAWLPGSEGQGVTDVLFGDYGFTGKLPRTWFKTVDQLPMNFDDPHYDPLFPIGFGLTTSPAAGR